MYLIFHSLQFSNEINSTSFFFFCNMWSIFLTVSSIKNIIVIRFSKLKNSECDKHNSDSNQTISMRENSLIIANFVTDSLIHESSHFSISWQEISDNSSQNSNQVHDENDFNDSSISLLNIFFKTHMMIRLSIKLFSEKKKILEHKLNSLSKKLNQQSDEYLMSDALQANKISVETSQKSLTKLSLMNKILNMKSHQSKSIMSEAFESDNDYFQKSQWFFHEEIEEYNESWNFSRKTDLLSLILSCSEFHISVSISSELNIIHFSQHLSTQDSEQIHLVIKNYDTIWFCFKKCLDEIDENLSKFIWWTDN